MVGSTGVTEVGKAWSTTSAEDTARVCDVSSAANSSAQNLIDIRIP